MLKVPPPMWAIAYVLIATAISYLAGWPRTPGLPLVPLAVVLIGTRNCFGCRCGCQVSTRGH